MILRYEQRTRHPGKIGNLYVQIDDDGSVRAHQNAGSPALDSDWTRGPDQAPVVTTRSRDQVDKLLRRHGFADLEPSYVAEAVQGGVIRTLQVQAASGQTRTVTVDRAKVPAFDKLVRALLDDLHLAEIPAS